MKERLKIYRIRIIKFPHEFQYLNYIKVLPYSSSKYLFLDSKFGPQPLAYHLDEILISRILKVNYRDPTVTWFTGRKDFVVESPLDSFGSRMFSRKKYHELFIGRQGGRRDPGRPDVGRHLGQKYCRTDFFKARWTSTRLRDMYKRIPQVRDKFIFNIRTADDDGYQRYSFTAKNMRDFYTYQRPGNLDIEEEAYFYELVHLADVHHYYDHGIYKLADPYSSYKQIGFKHPHDFAKNMPYYQNSTKLWAPEMWVFPGNPGHARLIRQYRKKFSKSTNLTKHSKVVRIKENLKQERENLRKQKERDESFFAMKLRKDR